MVLLLLLWNYSALASEKITVKEQGQATGIKAIQIPICQQQLTHLYVPNDRILHVTGLEDDYLLQQDNEAGQIYIKPLKQRRFTLFLQTENNQHYTLTLIPQRHCLPSFALPEPLSTNPNISAYEKEIVTLIEALENNESLADFEVAKPVSSTNIDLGYGLNMQLQQQVNNRTWQGEVYLLTNITNHAIYFSPQYLVHQMKDTNLAAIAYTNDVLKPGDSINLYKVGRYD
jgi:type-F conjugative transfer system secretin TraK